MPSFDLSTLRFEIKIGHNLGQKKAHNFKPINNIDSNISKINNQLAKEQLAIAENILKKRDADKKLTSIHSIKPSKPIDIHVIWEDLEFDRDLIRFKMSRVQKHISPIVYHGITKSLNTITKEYFERLFGKIAFHFSIIDGEIDQRNSRGFVKLLDTIEFIKHNPEGNFQQHEGEIKKYFRRELSKTDFRKSYVSLISKNIFIKYLAHKLSSNFRIIPIVESNNKFEEDAFIFRFETRKGKILVIWENAKNSRATYVFLHSRSKHQKLLGKLEEYIITKSIHNKRETLFSLAEESWKIKEKLLLISTIRHTNLEIFRQEIEYYLTHL
jgi:hypothetical protein